MQFRRNIPITWFSLWLLLFPFLPARTAAQPPAPAQQPARGTLNLVVIEGEGAVNNIRQRPGQPPIVQVEDENRQPVPAAAVVFTLPSQGPSGSFPDGSKTLVVTTDAQGRAVARGLRPNSSIGKLEIHVNASSQGRTAKTLITQFNMDVRTDRGGGSGKVVAIVALIGAGAAAGVVAGLRNKNGSTSAPAVPPITITPGTGTVGAP
ncbi:MAG TPA: hypothetical protein VH744_10205 [Terriglobales bacterium]|jgi:hypothetical protein